MKLLVTLLALAAATNTQAAPKRYTPPVEPEPISTPKAYFGQEVATGRWCAFDKATFERRSKADELEPGEFGWIRYSKAGLESIVVETWSEDAFASDRYVFDAGGKARSMARTGAYIHAPTATFTYTPDAKGHLQMTAAAREIVRRMSAAEDETYIVDWPRYDSLKAVPFGKRIDLAGGPKVRMGCG